MVVAFLERIIPKLGGLKTTLKKIIVNIALKKHHLYHAPIHTLANFYSVWG